MRRRSRLGVAGCFGLLGFVCAAWVSSLDDLKALLSLSAAEQGLLLAVAPLGNLLCVPFVPRLAARFGLARLTRLAALGYLACALFLAVAFARRTPVAVWCGGAAALGCAGNVLNIGANALGGVLESRAGRALMGTFHATFSVAMLAGVLFAQGAHVAGLSVAFRWTVLLAASAACAFLAVLFLPRGISAAPAARRGWMRPTRSLVALALVAAVVLGCENTAQEWAGVFFRETLSSPARAKWGLCALTLTMALGRLVSDPLVTRLGEGRLLRLSGLLTAAGLLLVAVSPCTGLSGLALAALTAGGFALAGFGLSGLVPRLYARASRAEGVPSADAVTFVSTVGFLGYLASPPLVGALAEATHLAVPFALFSALLLLVFLRR